MRLFVSVIFAAVCLAAEPETIVAWGRRGGPDGSNMSFNYGANALFGAVGHWGSCCQD